MSLPIDSNEAAPSTPARLGSALALIRRYLPHVGLLISAWSIWHIAHEIDPEALLRQLGRCDWLYLAMCAISIPITMIFKAVRWRYLFGPVTIPPLSARVSALYIGYLMNTVLPGRVGEFVRAYLIGRHESTGVPSALTSIVLEKLLDLSAIFVMLVALLLTVEGADWPAWVGDMSRMSLAGVVVGSVALGCALLSRRRVVAVCELVEGRFGLARRLRLAALATTMLESLAALGHLKALPGLLGWTAAIWGGAMLTVWWGILGAGVAVSGAGALLVLIVTNLGMAVPSAPGYLGVYHLLVVESLKPFGIEASQSAGAGLIVHLLIFGNFIVGGLWFLWRGGLSLRQLQGAGGH